MRIIGGSAKGTPLKAPAGKNTRPTLGHVRESIFNVLSNVGLVDTAVLDIFAGTGAMGLEALSRGAEKAVFFDKVTGGLILENARKCHLENRVKVIRGDIRSSLSAMKGETFDYIFLDPPYGKGYVNSTLALVFACGLPCDNAIIIVEHSISEPPDLSLFHGTCRVWKEKRIRDISVTYLLCGNSEGESS